jgi:hypothetical protein
MAGFLVRRRLVAQELQAHDAELAKRAASALLAADEGIRAASEELGFAEAELGAETVESAAQAIAQVRRRVTDAFRLNRLNHDAMPGTPDEVRARTVLILRLCESAGQVLGALTSALADRVAWSRQAGQPGPSRSADDPLERRAILPLTGTGLGIDAEPHARLSRVRAARTALDAATIAARDAAIHTENPTPPAGLLHHAIEEADRCLEAARDLITGHRGRIGDTALTRLAEAEHLRLALAQCLGGPESPASGPASGMANAMAPAPAVNRLQADRVLVLARRVASLATDSVQLARRDLSPSRRPRCAG